MAEIKSELEKSITETRSNLENKIIETNNNTVQRLTFNSGIMVALLTLVNCATTFILHHTT
jgi:hypothetical protein